MCFSFSVPIVNDATPAAPAVGWNVSTRVKEFFIFQFGQHKIVRSLKLITNFSFAYKFYSKPLLSNGFLFRHQQRHRLTPLI